MNRLIVTPLVAITMLGACAQQSNSDHYTTLLWDITQDSVQPVSLPEVKITDWLVPDNNSSGSIFEVGLISDMHAISLKRIELVTSNMLTNDLERKAQRDEFVRDAKLLLRSFEEYSMGREQSIVLAQVSQTINRQLSEGQCSNRTLYVVSDFMEHSALDFYDDSVLEDFEDEPESLYSFLDEKYPLEDLNGRIISIAMIHMPKSREEDKRFHRITSLLVPYYESKGIAVGVYSSLEEAIQYTKRS